MVLAPRDSALLAMKHDAVQAPTPRHASRRVRTSSGETFLSRSTTYGEETARQRLVVQLQNGSKNLLLTRPQAGNWVEEGSGAPLLCFPRLVPSNSFRQRLRGALPRSRARGRRAQTRQHTPPAPAEQPRSHAQAPAKDDLQRPHTVTGTHGPGASSLRARRAGQRRIPGRN